MVAVAVDVLYWTLWFAERSWVASNSRPAYYEFENAFPLADGWLALLCLLAWVALGRSRPVALLWLLAAGGAGIYLFAMDVLYDLENGIYGSGAGGIVEAGVNLLTLAFSLIALRWAWAHRAELLAPGPGQPSARSVG